MKVFEEVGRAIKSCEGYVINRIAFSVIDEADSLEIGFRWGPGKPDITVSFRSVYHFAIGKTLSSEALYVDKIIATELSPENDNWPDQLPAGIVRMPDLPALLWIRAEPLQLDVVGAIVTVLQEVC